ncbi:hypothetical protein AQUCO_02300025v1 [Aquilegia coerulea]|uniref:Receptor-like serine/threonine-protein kinase n=1 Tax=Aquilegia coerulea TaxID=218851 RepID=A0A2G5DBR0_AQUCA|nr:hypothetical protein AQUCO_02300025v1 [Aquilegia coerulea]
MLLAIPSSIFLFLHLFLFPISYANIPLGSTLTPVSTPNNNSINWTSPNNTYSLSFIPIASSYSAAISFSGIPVWKAGGDAGIVDSSARFELLLNGNLRLTNGSGGVVWESNTPNRGVTTALLDDSGNLSLRNGSIIVWSTFQNPTDTILPNQSFTTSMRLQSGSYSFSLLDVGNLSLRWNTDTIYWNQALNSSFNGNLSSPTLRFQQIGIIQLSDPTLSVPVNMAYSSDYGEGTDIFRYLRLDSDGNLRIYSSDRGSGTSTERWAAVLDQCRVYGWCGNMGICSYNDSTPVCGCPSLNFELSDPSDSKKGCRRKMEIEDCPSSTTMLQLEHTEFLTYPPELSSQIFFVGISACRLNCLVGSSCVASTSLADGTGQCYLKGSTVISGYQSPALPSTSYIKVCGPVQPNPSSTSTVNNNQSSSKKLPAWVVGVVVVSTLVGLVLLEVGLWFWCCRNSPKFGGLSAQYALLEYASGAPVQFSYKELQRSTKGFKEKLGAGGFGAVYRGVLANRTVVAVKQLEGIEQGEKQFRMEVATISSTHHLNLVRLIGFCSEGRHRLLVYEFMKNGSLDDFLFVKEDASGKLLDWETRFNVALGTARGITYLHEECRDCIVHCDIKPENILLDDNFNAKVCDFGLAKLINSKDHRYRTLTSVRGTRGYLAPEWLANLPITSKSDIYSYGMLLLEIVSGRRNFDVSAETSGKRFSIWAYEEFEKGNINCIVDKRLAEHEVDMEQAIRAIMVSFWCIQEQPSQRPTMGKVVQMLEGITAIGKPPVPKVMIDTSLGGTSSGNVSSSISALSTFATSAPAPSSSSSSSLQLGAISSVSDSNLKTTPSFI